MAKKLMIVDDRAISRQLMRQAAATAHDTVLECSNADDAIKSVGVFRPDCVMMGVSLPAPNVFKAIKAIRKNQPEVRVVAVSSHYEEAASRAASEAGAAGYVTTENLSELFLLAAPERVTLSPARRQTSRRRHK
jgi:DNA-binding NarL/FixJ family response regulator